MQGSKQQGKGDPFFGDLSFTVTAAHELKSPLSLIRQLSLALETTSLSGAEKQRLLHQITLVSERALRLTTDLSRTARLDDSLFEIEPLNPQQICEEVAHELSPLYKAKGRTIHVSSRYRPILAVANRDLLRRIMLNFADNALHYASDTEVVELRAASAEKGAKIRLGVRDYGPAVPVNVWQVIEASLGTGKQVIHGRPESSGLGLYIAGQFARAMHGRVGAIRHRNGATFYVDVASSRQLRLL